MKKKILYSVIAMTLVALVGLVGCSNVFGPPAFNPGNGKAAAGTGYVQLQFSTGRTVLPVLAFDNFELTFTKGEEVLTFTDEEIDLEDPIQLDVGTWDLEVTIYNTIEDFDEIIATGEAEVTIRAEQATTVDITLKFVPIPEGEGSFKWEIFYPEDGINESVVLADLTTAEILTLTDVESGTRSVSAGYYLATVSVEKANATKAVWCDIVQIYPGKETSLTVAATEFKFFSTLEFPKVIDDFTGVIGDYYRVSRGQNAFAMQVTDGRPNLWANIEPGVNTANPGFDGSIFGRNFTTGIDISAYMYAYTSVVLDLNVSPSPYTYYFELTVNEVKYIAEVINVQPAADILHAIPLSQLIDEDGTALLDKAGEDLEVTAWAIRCNATAGLTGTRLFGISLHEVQTRIVTKGATTGPVGTGFNFPGYFAETTTPVPVGNAVPVYLNPVVANNEFKGLTFTPANIADVTILSTTLCYFIMPDEDITVGAGFERMPEPAMWAIEDITGAAARGVTGWYGDWCNTTFGYWGINALSGWNSATQSGPHWIAANRGDAVQGSNYNVIQPLNSWIIQMEAATNLAMGRNLPAAMDISQKDTIRLLLRRSGTIDLELGLFNGGQPLAGYNGATDGTGVIDEEKSGTGYWVVIPANTTTTSVADSSWDFLEISLASFTSQGFNPALVTGYGIKVTNTISGTLHNRPRFYVDNIVAFAQADKQTIIAVNSTGGTISVPENYATALAGQIIPVTATPDPSYVFDGLITTPVAASANPDRVNATFPLAIIMPNESLTITGSFKIELVRLTVKTLPNKREYAEGEEFDPAGLELQAEWGNDTITDVALIDCAFVMNTARDMVTVTTGGKSVLISLKVDIPVFNFGTHGGNPETGIDEGQGYPFWSTESWAKIGQGHNPPLTVPGSVFTEETRSGVVVTNGELQFTSETAGWNPALRLRYNNTPAYDGIFTQNASARDGETFRYTFNVKADGDFSFILWNTNGTNEAFTAGAGFRLAHVGTDFTFTSRPNNNSGPASGTAADLITTWKNDEWNRFDIVTTRRGGNATANGRVLVKFYINGYRVPWANTVNGTYATFIEGDYDARAEQGTNFGPRFSVVPATGTNVYLKKVDGQAEIPAIDATSSLDSAIYIHETPATPLTVVPVTTTNSVEYTYQWYSNAANSNRGGTALTGATTTTFTPPTTAIGITYYYVVVSYKGISSASDPVKIYVRHNALEEGATVVEPMLIPASGDRWTSGGALVASLFEPEIGPFVRFTPSGMGNSSYSGFGRNVDQGFTRVDLTDATHIRVSFHVTLTAAGVAPIKLRFGLDTVPMAGNNRAEFAPDDLSFDEEDFGEWKTLELPLSDFKVVGGDGNPNGTVWNATVAADVRGWRFAWPWPAIPTQAAVISISEIVAIKK